MFNPAQISFSHRELDFIFGIEEGTLVPYKLALTKDPNVYALIRSELLNNWLKHHLDKIRYCWDGLSLEKAKVSSRQMFGSVEVPPMLDTYQNVEIATGLFVDVYKQIQVLILSAEMEERAASSERLMSSWKTPSGGTSLLELLKGRGPIKTGVPQIDPLSQVGLPLDKVASIYGKEGPSDYQKLRDEAKAHNFHLVASEDWKSYWRSQIKAVPSFIPENMLKATVQEKLVLERNALRDEVNALTQALALANSQKEEALATIELLSKKGTALKGPKPKISCDNGYDD